MASIAINLESPFPSASFLKKYLERDLTNSKVKNDIADVLKHLIMKKRSINFSLSEAVTTNPNTPEKNPKFIKPWGIHKHSISIKAIQIRRDKNNQLKNILKIKLSLKFNEEGELFIKTTNKMPVKNSTKGYLQDIGK